MAIINELEQNVTKKQLKCRLALAVSDFSALIMSFLLSCFILSFSDDGLVRFMPSGRFEMRLQMLIGLYLLCVGWFWLRLRHYTYHKPFWSELKECLRTIIIFAIFDLALVAISKWEISRFSFLSTWLFALLLLPVMRNLTKRLLLKLGLWQRATVIVGNKSNASDAYNALMSDKYLGFDVVAFVSDSKEFVPENRKSINFFNYQEFDFDSYSKNDTQFIIALEYNEREACDWWLRRLANKGFRNVSVIPALRGVPLYGTDMSYFFSHEVMILRINNNLTRGTSKFIKRSFDIVCSLLLLLVCSPLLGYLAWKVSRDGGSPFYGHERVGQYGKKFKCYKLRSMVLNSQAVLKNLLETNEEAKNEWERDFKLKEDPRITRVGHFIRNTSLDELPQLWNVLRGDMSLVGPRPVIEAELERYNEDVDYYLMAKPGMTGLWQVSGRNDVDYETRVYLDAWYVKNWTLWNDIAILFKTINVVLKRDGAY